VRNVDRPVTCKVRVKKTTAATIDLLKLVEQCGVKAVAVHARYVTDRPKDKARWPLLKEVTELRPVSIPIIANGDVVVYDDIARCRAATGADAVMIARGASYNVAAAFSPQGKPFEEVMREYVRVAIDVDQYWTNAKYNLLYMAKNTNQWLNKTDKGRRIHTSKCFEDILGALDLLDYYDAARRRFALRRSELGLAAEDVAAVPAPLFEDDEAEISRVMARTLDRKHAEAPAHTADDDRAAAPPAKRARLDDEPPLMHQQQRQEEQRQGHGQMQVEGQQCSW